MIGAINQLVNLSNYNTIQSGAEVNPGIAVKTAFVRSMAPPRNRIVCNIRQRGRWRMTILNEVNALGIINEQRYRK